MRHRRIQLAAAVAIVSIASVVATTALAGGGNDNVKAKLIGYEEVPAVSTVGSGKFKAKIDRRHSGSTTSCPTRTSRATSLFAHIHLGPERPRTAA